MTGETGMSLAVAGRKGQTVQTACRLAECSRIWRLRQETSDGRLLTDGTAECAAAAWTTTADGKDLAGLIPERVDSDMVAREYIGFAAYIFSVVAPYRSTIGMTWAPVYSWPVPADATEWYNSINARIQDPCERTGPDVRDVCTGLNSWQHCLDAMVLFTDLGLEPDLVGTGVCLFLVASFCTNLLCGVTFARLRWPHSAFRSTLNSLTV